MTDGLLGILGVAIGGGLALLTVAHTLEWHKQYMKANKKGKKAPSHPLAFNIPSYGRKPSKAHLCQDCFSFKQPKSWQNKSGYLLRW